MFAYAEEAMAMAEEVVELTGMQMFVSVLGMILPLFVLVAVPAIIALIVVLCVRSSKRKAPVQPPQVFTNQWPANDPTEAIEKLAKLHEQGILSDEEFQQKKAELLAKM